MPNCTPAAQGYTLVPIFSLPFCPHEARSFNELIAFTLKKLSLDITQPPDTEGNVAYGLLRPKRDEPSRLIDPDNKYLPS
ncbi:hypothetical protein D3C79_1071030 [compost metagenome]